MSLVLHRSRLGLAGVTVLTACLLASACSTSNVALDPRGFQNPRQLSFSCARVSDGSLEDLSACIGQGELAESERSLALGALVTEVDRGEIAAADLFGVRLLDTQPAVPGFTFQPVGELPSGVAQLLGPAQRIVSASFGNRSLEFFPATNARPDLNSVVLQPEVLALSSAPGDMVALPGRDALLITLPEQAAVALVAHDGSAASEQTRLDLAATLPDVLLLEQGLSAYERVCAPQVELSPLPETLVAPPLRALQEGAALPGRLVVDPERNRIFVADERLPVVHELSFDDALVLTERTIAAGSPQVALALSPSLPLVLGEEAGPSQVLYAVDAVDRSVFALEVHPDSDTRDHRLVLSTDLRAPYTLELEAPAEQLAILAPEASEQACSAETPGLQTAADPAQLRGLFLAVGTLDGTAEFFDIVDLDAVCRGESVCAGNPQTGVEVSYALARHRPRSAQLIRNLPSLLRQPSFVADGARIRVGTDGGTDFAAAPRLDALEACPLGQVQVFPANTVSQTPVICAQADPWLDQEESWVALYESTLPGANGNAGRLERDESGWRLVDRARRFCGRGVMGAAQAEALAGSFASADGSYGGDQLELSASDERVDRLVDDDACAALLRSNDGSARSFQVAISQSEAGQLRLADETFEGVPLEVLADCIPGAIRYAARTRGAFLVVGGASEVLHPLETQEDGVCGARPELSFDPSRPLSAFRARAFAGQAFSNRQVSFAVSELRNSGEAVADSERATRLEFALTNDSQPLVLDLGASSGRSALPTDLSFNLADDRLYVIDATGRRLLQVELQPVGLLAIID